MDISQYTSKQIRRFWSQIDRRADSECWNWLACKNSKGYGQIRLNNKMIFAHRLSYALTRGAIPQGMLVCHHCDNRRCCNPSHLFLGTNADNMRDMDAKGRRRALSGAKSGRAKLTIEQVAEIRRLYAEGGISQRKLGRIYGVGHAAIGAIVRRVSYR